MAEEYFRKYNENKSTDEAKKPIEFALALGDREGVISVRDSALKVVTMGS